MADVAIRNEFRADSFPVAFRDVDESPVTTMRYLPLHRLASWDLRYEQGLEILLYVQNLIDED